MALNTNLIYINTDNIYRDDTLYIIDIIDMVVNFKFRYANSFFNVLVENEENQFLKIFKLLS